MNHTVDKAVTPQNIKSGFRCTGICSFDSDVFNETDFIEAVLSGENDQAAAVETLYNEEEQRRIFVSNEQDVTAHEEVSTSEPSTSAGPSSVSRSESLSSLLSEIGPMQAATPAKKSNRGRKPMRSTILTSPSNIDALKTARAKRDSLKAAKEARAQKKTLNSPTKKPRAKKNQKRNTSQTSEATDVNITFNIL